MPPVETVAERIKRLRDAREITQATLAYELGVAVATISRWESPRGVLPMRHVRHALASALGVSVRYLMTGADAVAEPAAGAPRAPSAPPARGAGDRRVPVLAPLRAAVARIQALGESALSDFVDAVVELAREQEASSYRKR